MMTYCNRDRIGESFGNFSFRPSAAVLEDGQLPTGCLHIQPAALLQSVQSGNQCEAMQGTKAQ